MASVRCRSRLRPAVLAVVMGALLAPSALAADWDNLLGDGLDAWTVLGEGLWRLRSDGVLSASFGHGRQKELQGPESIDRERFVWWTTRQSWLYTKRDYTEYDLHLEYWVNTPGNSGVSIRDPSQARCGIAQKPDFDCTPSKLGYEIQINSEYSDRWMTGSIYGLARAEPGLARVGEWNSLNIESRKDSIRVFVNGVLAAEHAGDPERPLSGPIGLQLHDVHSFALFRNVWILER